MKKKANARKRPPRARVPRRRPSRPAVAAAARRPARAAGRKSPRSASLGAAARAAPAPPGDARASGPGRWLIKTEPELYSYADLEREGRTRWDGVANNLALIHLRTMREGEPVLVYHTGAEKAVVGLARVARGPYLDPALGDGRRVAVDLVPVARAASAVAIAAIREEPSCRELGLVRIPRLSVMPVPAAAFAAIARKGGLPPGDAG